MPATCSSTPHAIGYVCEGVAQLPIQGGLPRVREKPILGPGEGGDAEGPGDPWFSGQLSPAAPGSCENCHHWATDQLDQNFGGWGQALVCSRSSVAHPDMSQA